MIINWYPRACIAPKPLCIQNDLFFKHVDISSKMSDNDETKPSWERLLIEIKHKSTNSKHT